MEAVYHGATLVEQFRKDISVSDAVASRKAVRTNERQPHVLECAWGWRLILP
tara:strand:+ start:57 stop:212 length:156 start_codon:yes stop_codon:yes gene_type:complete